MITLGIAYFSYCPYKNDPYGLLHVKYGKDGFTHIQCVRVDELYAHLRIEEPIDVWRKRTAIEMFAEWSRIL
jgi:hypothetical protein